jgi:hypothetical protein
MEQPPHTNEKKFRFEMGEQKSRDIKNKTNKVVF